MSKIHLLKFLDRSCGAMLARILPIPRLARGMAPAPQTALVIRPGGIGDAVHLAPFINTLRSTYPQLQLDILAERRNAGAFHLIRGIGRILCYDRPGDWMRLLRSRYDAVIDTEQWHYLSAIVARLVTSPVKVGFATNERARMFTCAVSYCQDEYEAINFLRLLAPLAVPMPAFLAEPWLNVPQDDSDSIASLIPCADGGQMVAIFPGASIPAKKWDPDRFRAVAAWCLAHALQVVLLGGESEREEGGRIVAGLGVVNLIGKTILAQTAAIIARAAVVVSGDSGVLHVAAGLGRPTVALFGPSSAIKWAPRGERHIALQSADCTPCSRFGNIPPCPHDNRCMCEITVDDVTRAIDALLHGS